MKEDMALENPLNTPESEKNELLEENRKLKIEIKKLNRQLALANDNVKKYQSVSVARENFNAILASEKSKQERQFRLLMENAPDIVILLDRSMHFLSFTKSFSDLADIQSLGLTSRQSFRQVFSTLVNESSLEHMEAIVKKALETNTKQFFDKKLFLGSADNTRTYAVSAIPFAYDADANDGILMIFHDMSERIEMENKIREALHDATVASKAKSDFLANMSHEIRTPMNAILGMVDLILYEDTSNTVLSHATDIRNACRGLLTIINDILDISKIEAGKLEIVPARYHISSLLVDTISITKMRTAEKNITFSVNIDPNIPRELIGDEMRIKQVLVNFLNNAVKFTHEGQITLSVVSQVKNDVCHLHFSVEDTGIGIKPEDLEKIFVLFQQLDTKRNRNLEGTGLGLSISKQLVEMMGGSIEIKSAYGVGSTFTVSIRQHIANAQPLTALKHPEQNSVLIYENRQAHLKALTVSLDSLGCTYTVCADRSAIFSYLDESPYNYIFISSLYIKAIHKIISDKQPDAVIVVVSDDGSTYNTLPSISMPIHCLQVTDIFNDEYHRYESRDKTALTSSILAPEAKVLVVDDNAVNLKVAAGFLNICGIKAETAPSGMRAVEMVAETDYDLVFMDHMMPEMDGIDTTLAIRSLGEKYKQLPIIALTANAVGGVMEMFIAEGLDDFLAKPIEMTKLSKILEKWIPADKQKQRTDVVCCEEFCPEISGLDTRKGIINSGGTCEAYNEILEIYVTDCEGRLNDLATFHRESDIKALTICAHALKSASANVGADHIATMAAELELAGKVNDIIYINASMRRFTDSILTILDNIRGYLVGIGKKDIVQDKVADLHFLNTSLIQIGQFMDNLDIDSTERVLSELYAYQWDESIFTWIYKMKDCIDIFDYDGIAEAVIRLKALSDAKIA